MEHLNGTIYGFQGPTTESLLESRHHFCHKKNDVKTAKYLLKRQENPVNLLKLVNSGRSGGSVRLGRAVVAE